MYFVLKSCLCNVLYYIGKIKKYKKEEYLLFSFFSLNLPWLKPRDSCFIEESNLSSPQANKVVPTSLVIVNYNLKKSVLLQKK